jgi:hypothetical protein
VEKPWNNAQLLLVIQSAIEHTQLFRQLREKIAELDGAPQHPQGYPGPVPQGVSVGVRARSP